MSHYLPKKLKGECKFFLNILGLRDSEMEEQEQAEVYQLCPDGSRGRILRKEDPVPFEALPKKKTKKEVVL